MTRPCRALASTGAQLVLTVYGIALICLGTAAAIEWVWLTNEARKAGL